MTRLEYSNTRSLAFSSWIRKKLPDSSSGFCVTNTDWVLWNWKTRNLMFLEEKTHKASLATWFSKLIKEVIDPAIREFSLKNDINYHGYHLIQFEFDDPTKGQIWYDQQLITEDELQSLLSF